MRFIEEQDPGGLWSSFRQKALWNKVPLVGPILINKFLLVGDKFVPEMHSW